MFESFNDFEKDFKEIDVDYFEVESDYFILYNQGVYIKAITNFISKYRVIKNLSFSDRFRNILIIDIPNDLYSINIELYSGEIIYLFKGRKGFYYIKTIIKNKKNYFKSSSDGLFELIDTLLRKTI